MVRGLRVVGSTPGLEPWRVSVSLIVPIAGKRKYISAFLDFLEQSESDPLSRHNTRVCDGFSVSDAIRPEPAEA